MEFILLLAGLTLFLISTNQWSLAIRGGVWAVGLLLLVGAAYLTWINPQHAGGVLDALQRPGFMERMGKSSGSIAFYVLSLLDLFLVFGLLLGIIALIAFTPGDALERALRPWLFGLLGAVLGGALATALIGSGGVVPSRDPVVANNIQRDDIVTGDTFYISQNGIPQKVRLFGIDAPEADQQCRGAGGGDRLRPCANMSSDHLFALFQQYKNQNPICSFVADEGGKLRTDDERNPIVRCQVTGTTPVDISYLMVSDGFAVNYHDNEAYREAAYAARGRPVTDQSPLMRTCTLYPAFWRSDATARADFSGAAPRKVGANKRMGDCSRLPQGGGGNNNGGPFVPPP